MKENLHVASYTMWPNPYIAHHLRFQCQHPPRHTVCTHWTRLTVANLIIATVLCAEASVYDTSAATGELINIPGARHWHLNNRHCKKN